MSRPLRAILTPLIASLTLAWSPAPPPNVEEILAEAIERARLNEEHGHEVLYHYRMRTLTDRLGRDGEVKDTEQLVFESQPIGGIAYERLVRKDGRELTEGEQRKEANREEKFRKKVAEGKAKHNDVDERVAFDERLVSHYQITLEGEERVEGRRCYLLAFAPKEGELPNERRFDRVLNRSEGRIWIDAESYEIARLTFELQEKVRLWWGMIGSISALKGEFSRRPAEGDETIWLPQRFDVYMNGRVLFRSLHMRQKVSWSGFVKRETPATADESADKPASETPRQDLR